MEWYRVASSVVSGIGLVNCLTFCVWWGIRSRMRWMRTENAEHGWFLMAVATVFGSLFGIILINQTLGEWPGRQIVSLTVFILLVLLTFWFPRILWVSRPRNGEES